MFSKRSFIAAAVCAVALPLAACGGSDSTTPPGADAAPPVTTPEGTHYGYVVSKAYVPATTGQTREYGLDLGSAKSGTPDGTIDNRLGESFVTLGGFGFNIQTTITTAVDHGSIMLLLDYQTKDFATASLSGFGVKIGATSTPTACADANDMVCRHHLNGDATFTLSATSPTNALVTGAVASGTFTGGPGNLSLQVAVGSTDPVQLNLHNARAKVTGASATGLTAVIAGALTVTDLNTSVIPAIQHTLEGVLLADCGPVADRNVAMGCSCQPGSSSSTILGVFDGKVAGTTADCAVSVDEIVQSNFTKAALGPDICSTSTCTAPDALSFGIKVDAVKATIQ